MGFEIRTQLTIPIKYEDIELDAELRLDILVNESVIVEVKACSEIIPIHQAQILSYMKLLSVPKGMLINFHTEKIINSTERFANDLFWNLPD